jgi:RNase P subunit RPR2
MTADEREIRAAAEAERLTLLAQAAREHLNNIETECRHYQSEMDQIERVYRMRIGQEN